MIPNTYLTIFSFSFIPIPIFLFKKITSKSSKSQNLIFPYKITKIIQHFSKSTSTPSKILKCDFFQKVKKNFLFRQDIYNIFINYNTQLQKLLEKKKIKISKISHLPYFMDFLKIKVENIWSHLHFSKIFPVIFMLNH